jgi:Uncharacterized conserved protein
MRKTILSIGHSQHDTEYFIKMLKKHEVNYLLDVRSMPYSQFASDYDRDNIRAILLNNGINYSFMGECFGARQLDRTVYSMQGRVDFEKVKKGDVFKKGFNNVMRGIEQGNRIAFMCTEKDPIECHRAILVTRVFEQAGIHVEHIMADSSIQTQRELNERLLNMYYPDRKQFSIFDVDNLSEEEHLLLAYKKQNEKIGYFVENELKKSIV